MPLANTWIFQCTQDRFDLSLPESLNPGTSVDWRVTRYRDDMKPADDVYFWMAGDDKLRGIYGKGRLVSEAYRDHDKDSWRVGARVTARFEPPVLASELKKDSGFARSLILRQPEGSNFRLTPEEADAIERAVARLGELAGFSEQVRAIITRAEELRSHRNAQWIDVEDMLQALAEQPHGQLRTLIADARVTFGSLSRQLTTLLANAGVTLESNFGEGPHGPGPAA